MHIFLPNVCIGLDFLHPHIYCHTYLCSVSSHINSQNLSTCSMLYFISVFSSLKWCNTMSSIYSKHNWECQFPKESRPEKEKQSFLFLPWISSRARMTCLIVPLLSIQTLPPFKKNSAPWVFYFSMCYLRSLIKLSKYLGLWLF